MCGWRETKTGQICYVLYLRSITQNDVGESLLSLFREEREIKLTYHYFLFKLVYITRRNSVVGFVTPVSTESRRGPVPTKISQYVCQRTKTGDRLWRGGFRDLISS